MATYIRIDAKTPLMRQQMVEAKHHFKNTVAGYKIQNLGF